MNEKRSPLRIYCRNCGTPAEYDIVHQTYRCGSCGELTGIREAKDAVYRWRKLQKDEMRSVTAGQQMEECACPSCGALIVFGAGEASETCMFCGSKLTRGAFSDADQLPDLIIPFVITPEEAKKRLLQWGHAHEKTPEGKSVVSSMGKFTASYLPYRVVKGPVSARVTRDGTNRTYECGGFLRGTAVNTSKQLDNLVLNEMEPFDWSAARPFEYGYIAGMPVKLNDSTDALINARIEEEVRADFTPAVERAMQTSGVDIQVQTGDVSVLTALLPVYFIKSGKLTAVMNGQTGRIAVSREREKKSFPWVIEPLIYTTVLAALMGWWSKWNGEMLCYSAMVFGAILFSIFSEGRHSLIRRVILRSRSSTAVRQDGALSIQENRDSGKHADANTPVFYEHNAQGQKVPVRIRFYTPGRWLSILLNAFVTVMLPALLAAPLRLSMLEEGESFWAGFHLLYGAAWYTLAALIVLVYFAKGVRKDVYDHPIVYEILPNGGKRLMGNQRDRRLSLLAMFGVGSVDREGKRLSLFGLLRSLGGTGVGIAVITIFVLLGSTAAIVF